VTQPFTISRTFDAPRDRVWAAFTEAQHLQHWMTPPGFTMPGCTVDLRPGGVFHYCMRALTGQEMWGKWTYREIEPPHRLVVIVEFSDKDGGVTRHPMAPTWPLHTLSETTLAEDGGKTTITVRWWAHEANAIEQQTFDASHEAMRMGWSGSADQLAAYLKKG
jgi:uncharacterized protein YndB with AHSA1/START domain